MSPGSPAAELSTPQSASARVASDDLLSGRSTVQHHSHRCTSPVDGDPLASDLFGAGTDDAWADEPEAEECPDVGWGGTPLLLREEGPRYLSDGELVLFTFNVNGGLTGLSTAASSDLEARDGVTSKLAQILEYGHARGAHVIALQEVRLTQRDVEVMDRDGRFGTYRPKLCAAGGRRSPCGVLLLLDPQLDRGVQSHDDISNRRYAGALVADAGVYCGASTLRTGRPAPGWAALRWMTLSARLRI